MTFGNKAILVVGACCAVIVTVRAADLQRRERPAAAPAVRADARPNAYASSTAPAPQLVRHSEETAAAESRGCMTCHTATDETSMHPSGTVRVPIGCAFCHGGDATVTVEPGLARDSAEYKRKTKQAHVQPKVLDVKSANPERAYVDWLRESREYIKFVNPGDLRVVDETCGGCHASEVRNVPSSMMTHGAMLWGAALYNNGGVPFKNPRYGESYDQDGQPRSLVTFPAPTAEETRLKGVLPYLDPLPRWEITQPGNVLRVFERGGRKKSEIGNPNRLEEPGRPDNKLSERGFGTLLRTDPVFLGLQKTRLLDPLLSLPGTNDQPGDYRGSGCTACHVVYVNDRSPDHSGAYSQHKTFGTTVTADPTINRTEPGHPLKHEFTRQIPSSQCMTCHMHPGTNMVTTYYGYTWWENETEGQHMYDPDAKTPGEGHRYNVRVRNPEQAAARGKWGEIEFLSKIGELGDKGKPGPFNQQLRDTQFADFHGHGWVYRAVYKRDREGNLLDRNGKIIGADASAKFPATSSYWDADKKAMVYRDPEKDPDIVGKAVHLKDIHLEKGMQCVDCHFNQDNHGNGKLYGETRNAVEIDCVDCHGSVDRRATLITSGPAAPQGGTALSALRTPWRQPRFYWQGDQLYQRSMLDPNKEWRVKQTVDAGRPDPDTNKPNLKGQYAHTIQTDNATWTREGAPPDGSKLAHPNQATGPNSRGMTCFSCHTSWAPTCFGCHLSMVANRKMPMLHNEGLDTRNWTAYNFQVLRDDAFFLGVDGTVTKNRFAPVRSACAVLVSSQAQSRAWLYYMQQTVSAEGFSGQAFSTFVPHTVRTQETKECADCHVSRQKDNNAWLANVTLQGTNFMNFIGHNVWVAAGHEGFEGIAVAERDEPPAIIGSHLHKLAFPEEYAKHVKRGLALEHAHHHPGENVLDVQQRGEYVYAALGKGGFRAYDIANIDNKDFSERIVTAPVSPLGQKFYLKTKNAVAIATPTTLGVDPLRKQLPENEEQPMIPSHLIYGYLYVADTEEGLIVVGDSDLTYPRNFSGVGSLLDGNPTNNFMKRAATFNPDGVLTGARRIITVGTYGYILTPKALVVVNLKDPRNPVLASQVPLDEPRGIAVQFRYGFVVDKHGLQVLDVTRLDQPRLIDKAKLDDEVLHDARNIYLARTYAYIAAGHSGLVIVDIKKPEEPKLVEVAGRDGKPAKAFAAADKPDTHDVKIGMTNASLFAYLADGHNGLQVVQIFSPEDNANHYGFSPKPTPKLVAHFPMHGDGALMVSEGIDRDRAVDESGNQLAVFGRRGARPLKHDEIEALYRHRSNGQFYDVPADTSNPPPPARTTTDMGWFAILRDYWYRLFQ